MYLLQNEVVKIISSSTSSLEAKYTILKFLKIVFGYALDIFKFLYYVGGIIIGFSIVDIFKNKIILFDSIESIVVGIFFILIGFGILNFSKMLYLSFKKKLEIADKFFIFVKNVENGQINDSFNIIIEIFSETEKGNNTIFIVAYSVSILILVDFFDEDVKSEYLDKAIEKLSLLEGLSINEKLVFWGKARMFLRMKRFKEAEGYIAKFKGSFPNDVSNFSKLEVLLAD